MLTTNEGLTPAAAAGVSLEAAGSTAGKVAPTGRGGRHTKSRKLYRRLGKGGREVWIQASYNPVFDKAGLAIKVIKFATDVTAVENERTANEQRRQQLSAE